MMAAVCGTLRMHVYIRNFALSIITGADADTLD
jgi:hypothetical protein